MKSSFVSSPLCKVHHSAYMNIHREVMTERASEIYLDDMTNTQFTCVTYMVYHGSLIFTTVDVDTWL